LQEFSLDADMEWTLETGAEISQGTWSPGQVILQSSQYFHWEGSTGILAFLFHQRLRAVALPPPPPPPPLLPVCWLAWDWQ